MDIRETVQSIKAAILKSQARAAQMVNHEQLSLYYGIGRYISEHSREGYWGTGAIARISKQLKAELPGLKGFSEENIKLMRRFYEAWKDIETNSVVGTTEILQVPTQQLPTNSVDVSDPLDVDEEKLPEENPSVGIILCKKADKAYVEYVLQDYVKPMGVATYQQMQDRLKKLLPPEDEMKWLLE